jgi:hypothetical protein
LLSGRGSESIAEGVEVKRGRYLSERRSEEAGEVVWCSMTSRLLSESLLLKSRRSFSSWELRRSFKERLTVAEM